MDGDIRDLLGEEIRTEIQDLSALAPGSSEKSAAIQDLAILYKLRIEETKNQRDCGDLAEQARDRRIRLGVEAAGIILPLIFYAVWMKMGFKFEENGTYTSTTFRGLFSRFKATNK
jgi:hypothetical protein